MANISLGIIFRKYTKYNLEYTYGQYREHFEGEQETSSLIGNNYIYIFIKYDKDKIEVQEIKGTGQLGDNSKIEKLQITNLKDDYWKYEKGKRENGSPGTSEIIYYDIDAIKAGARHYFMISSYQLSTRRIESIKKQLSNDKCTRVKHLVIYNESLSKSNIDVVYNNSNLTTVYLTDYLEYAEKLSKEYIEKRDDYLNYMKASAAIYSGTGKNESHPRNELMMLSDLVNTLCNIEGRESKYQDHVFWEYAKRWRNEALKPYYYKISDYQIKANYFTKWINQPEFLSTLFDYELSNDEEDAYYIENKVGEMIYRFAESIKGQEYFEKVYNEVRNDVDTLEKKYGRTSARVEDIIETCGEKWFDLFFYTGRKATLGFANIVEAFSKTIIDVTIKKEPVLTIIDVLTKIMDRRFSAGFVSTTLEKLASYKVRYPNLNFWKNKIQARYKKCLGDLVFKEEGNVVVAYFKKAQVVKSFETETQVKQNWAAKLKDSEAFKRILIGIEIFNLGMAIWTLANSSDDAWILNTLNLFGAIIDLLIQIVKKESTQAILGIVSGVLEAITFSGNAYQAYEVGDYETAVGYSIAAAGGLVCATGAAITLGAWVLAGASGGAAAGGPPGAAAGAIIGAIGCLIEVIGMAIAFYFTDDDYTIWLHHCLWGKRYGQDDKKLDWSVKSLKLWENDIRTQIAAFNNICYNYSFKLVYIPISVNAPVGLLQLYIEPSFLNPVSKMYISVKIKAKLDSIVIADNLEILQTNQCSYLYKRDKKIESVSVYWCDKTNFYIGLKDTIYSEVTLKAMRYFQSFINEENQHLDGSQLREQIVNALINDVIQFDNLRKDIFIRSYQPGFLGGLKPLEAIVKVKLDIFGDSTIVIEKEANFNIQDEITMKEVRELAEGKYKEEIDAYTQVDAISQ